MSSTESLAQKIAQILESERAATDLSSVHTALDKINARLDKLETLTEKPKPVACSANSAHPSLDRFAIAEAIADQIFADVNKEKACTFEPNGRPCDHCSMCSSRGF